MSTKHKPFIVVSPLVKEVANDHGLGGNSLAVYLHLVQQLTADPFYTLEQAGRDIEKEMLKDWQRMDVMSAVKAWYQADRCQPLSF